MRNTVLRVVLLVGFAVAGGVGIHGGGAVASSKTPVVLELFTSEGCSSCPPADRLLQLLDEKQPFDGADLIVLSEHVDYWNEGGWVDPYSSKLFSARQQSYARHFGLDSVYTPQVVVDGARETVGGNAAGIRNAVKAALRSQKIALTLANVLRNGNGISFHLASADLPASEGSATVYVALAENKVVSHINGGENVGRPLSHVAVVRAFASVGTVEGGSAFSKDVTIPAPSGASPSEYRVVAFVQGDHSRKIVGATHEKIQD